jgi:hypothetical protein
VNRLTPLIKGAPATIRSTPSSLEAKQLLVTENLKFSPRFVNNYRHHRSPPSPHHFPIAAHVSIYIRY